MDKLPTNHLRLGLSGKDYYDTINQLKLNIKKEKNKHYIHFRNDDNFVSPKSNQINNITSVSAHHRFVNLKKQHYFESLFLDYLKKNSNLSKIEINFIQFFIREIFKVVQLKFAHSSNITLSKVIDMHINYRKTFEDYNHFSDQPLHSHNIYQFINDSCYDLDIHFLLNEFQQNLRDTNHLDSFSFDNQDVEIFDHDNSIYESYLNYLISHFLDKDFLINEQTTYVLFDEQPSYFLKEKDHFILTQLRGINVYFVFPDTDKNTDIIKMTTVIK